MNAQHNDPDPDAHYAEIERDHWQQLRDAEYEREEQQWFEENEEWDDGYREPPICQACNGTGQDWDLTPCTECDGEGYYYWL